MALDLRIALMTWFQYHNYGTALQLYALSSVLESFGCEVDVVDYRARTTSAIPESCSLLQYAYEKAGKSARGLHEGLRHEPPERENLFECFIAEEVDFSRPCPTLADLEMLNDDYDAFVCGSDQIWNPSLFDPHYFLDFAGDDKLKVAYAPSVGTPVVRDSRIASQISRLAGRLDFLSTREKAGSDMLSKLINRSVETVLDPTLLLSKERWGEFARRSKSVCPEAPYMLVYMLGRNEGSWRRVYEVAEELDLEVKVIPVFKRDISRHGCLLEPIVPKEFVALIADASFVCTDSFHGIAFSMCLEREFCAFDRFRAGDPMNQNSRVHNILELVNLRERLWGRWRNYDEIVSRIEWGNVRGVLAEHRERSLDYLINALTAKRDIGSVKNHIFRDRGLCCGCGACAAICPRNTISIEVDSGGFDRAHVDEGGCVSCGRCRDVCPFASHMSSRPVAEGSLYSFKDGDSGVLERSSSGGAAFRLALESIKRGMHVVGVRYDTSKRRASHIVVNPSNPALLLELQGSKYLQSNFADSSIWLSESEDPVAVFGTPCQIAAVRNLVSPDRRTLLVDLICHGIPSGKLFDKYIEYLVDEKDLESGDIHIAFRYKARGWHQKYMFATDGKKTTINSQDKDPFLLAYEHRLCYCDCCYECPWRDVTAADIRIGDYWGSKFEEDQSGVSMVIAMTECGAAFTSELASYGELRIQSNHDYFAAQQIENVPPPTCNADVMNQLAVPSTRMSKITHEYIAPLERRRWIDGKAAAAKKLAKILLRR